MWKVILFLSLSLGPFGSYLAEAETIPAPTRTHSYWWVGSGICVSDDAVANYPACQIKSASAMCSYFGGGVQEAKTDIVFCDNGRTGFPQKDTYRGPCPPGYETELYGTQCYRPDPPKPDPGSACTGAQLANYCASMSGKSVDVSKFADKIAGRSRMCDNVNTQAPGCLMVEGTGCRITSNFPSTGKFSYNGQACARLPDGDPNNNEGSPSSCAAGEYYGTVNGVTGCYGGGPVPPSDKPPVDQTGKDANGNCAAGYVGRIKNNQLECTPSHVPSDGATCPSGWNAVGVGGKTVCVDPSAGPGGGSGGSDGSGGTGGTPGGGGGTGGNTGGNNGGKGDASSPGGKPGEGDKPGEKCQHTGLLSFLCDSAPPAFNPDTEGLSGESGGNLASLLDTKDFVFGTSACPPDIVVHFAIGGSAHQLNFPYKDWCTFASYIRPVVIAISFVSAAFIIFWGRVR